MPLTLDKIIPICFPTVLTALSYGNPWVKRSLNCKQQHGKIILKSLGTCIEVTGADYETRSYPVDELCVSLCWSSQDDINNPTEANKVILARNLITNGLHSHDHTIFTKMKRGRAVVSPEYRYNLSPVISLENGNFICKIYTVLAFIP